MSDHISIASFAEHEEAQALADRLLAEGFDATIQDDSVEQFWKFYNMHPRAQCHVCVAKAVVDAALQRLSELDAAEDVLQTAVRCPEYRSSQVEYPQFSRGTIVGALPSIAAAAGIIKRQFYCSSCHFTWPPAADPVDTVPAGKDLLK